jgi:isopentenyl diphosphate isomerase/L-lactate dehydrogenase-like FMN-dependent dehydrogenase
MTEMEKKWLESPGRRKALVSMAGLMAAAPGAALAQRDPYTPLSQIHRIPGILEMRNAFDFEEVFAGNLVRTTYETTNHGDGSEWNMHRNRDAFDWIDVVRAAAPVPPSQVDLSTELFGVKTKYPILVAPSSGQNGLHPEGERGMFKGATEAGAIDILAGSSPASVAAAVKEVPTGTLWAQHYPVENLEGMARSLGGIQDAGSNVIVVTVDQQVSVYERTLMMRNLGGRPRGMASGGEGAGGEGGNGAALAAAAAARAADNGGPPVTGSVKYRVSGRRLWYTWGYIDAVRKVVKGKMMVKGIIVPEDAVLAIEHGADGIVVSNHGGRAMDYGPSTIESLPEIVAAVRGRVPIFIDSGFRRGADVFKALALGANGVLLGRAARWGLGAYGPAGAQRVIEIIQQELVQTASAAGCRRLSDINASKVRTHFV